MTIKPILLFLTFLGCAISVAAIFYDNKAVTTVLNPIPAVSTPYSTYIAGAGIVEASTENINIGTPVSGIVKAVAVKAGDHVEAGAILFQIDDADLQANLLPALAKINEAQANLEKSTADLDIAEKAGKSGAISHQELIDRRADANIRAAELETAKAEVNKIKKMLERYSICSPISGDVLQVKTHMGEFAQADATSGVPLMILGGSGNLNVRVDLDEYDSWRFKPNEEAMAFARGNPAIKSKLKFVRIEPLILTKTSLTGSATERTDTRVLQAIYSIEDSVGAQFHIGEQVDVYIQTPESGKPESLK